mgnify:FL=1
MPTYRIRHKETGEMFEGFMSISEKEEFMKENLEFEQVFDSVNIIGGVDGQRKIDDGFKEVLQKVAQENPNSPLAEKLGGRNVKEIKTQQVKHKHGLGKTEWDK